MSRILRAEQSIEQVFLYISLGAFTMPRQKTKLEPEGAGFLVLGKRLTIGIPSYRAHKSMAG